MIYRGGESEFTGLSFTCDLLKSPLDIRKRRYATRWPENPWSASTWLEIKKKKNFYQFLKTEKIES